MQIMSGLIKDFIVNWFIDIILSVLTIKKKTCE